MFPLRENVLKIKIALTALLMACTLGLMAATIMNYNVISDTVSTIVSQALAEKFLKPPVEETVKPSQVANLKDTWQLLGEHTFTREKVRKLAEKYQADPEYLSFIIEVEKLFDLEPCHLLALIAQESGFKPKTHMDGGSLSYSTTQMKLPAAVTAYKAITEYYGLDIAYPTDEIMRNNQYYATVLAGGYLKYLNDTYRQDAYQSYSAYNLGIGGKNQFYKKHGHYKSPYAVKVVNLKDSFLAYIGQEYYYQDDGEESLLRI